MTEQRTHEQELEEYQAFELEAQQAPDGLVKQPKTDAESPVQGEIFSDVMPNVSPAMLEMPNIFALTNLFPISMRRKNANDEVKHLKEHELNALKGLGTFRYTGPQLTRDHADVFLALVKKVQLNQQSIMAPVYVSLYEILEAIGRSTGKKNYEMVRQVLKDLDQMSLEISDERLLKRLIRYWDNRHEFSPEMQAFLEDHTPLIKGLKERFKEGNRFLTIKFIRNLIGEMGAGERFGVNLDPYTVLMYGPQNTIRVPSQAHKEYREKLTHRLVSIIRYQAQFLFDWTEAQWQDLILPEDEQMNFDRKNRNRRARFRKNFEGALSEAESWGELLPGWIMEESFHKEDGMRGQGHKTFKTRFIRRLHPDMRTLLIKDRIYNGQPDHVFFCYLQSCVYLLNDQQPAAPKGVVKITFDQLAELFRKAPYPNEGQPQGYTDASAEAWEGYLRLVIATYKSKGLLPDSTEVTYETMNGQSQLVLMVNLDEHLVFKKLRKQALAPEKIVEPIAGDQMPESESY